jgi:hypothetical protein
LKEKELKKQLAEGRITQAKIDEQKLKDMKTPYTCANGGQQKFGGITPEGKKRFSELVEMITKNRVDNKDAIKVVEDRVLVTVRDKKGRPEIDAKKNQKKPKKIVVAPVEPEEHVDERDFRTWV